MYLAGVGRVGEEWYTERYTRATKGASVHLEPARYLKDSNPNPDPNLTLTVVRSL